MEKISIHPGVRVEKWRWNEPHFSIVKGHAPFCDMGVRHPESEVHLLSFSIFARCFQLFVAEQSSPGIAARKGPKLRASKKYDFRRNAQYVKAKDPDPRAASTHLLPAIGQMNHRGCNGTTIVPGLRCPSIDSDLDSSVPTT